MFTTCGDGYCQPVGQEIGYLNVNSTASITVPVSIPSSDSGNATARYLEIDYINNDIALSTSWGYGSNSRNLTVSLNSGDPIRLEVPLSGRHSELFWAWSWMVGCCDSGIACGRMERWEQYAGPRELCFCRCEPDLCSGHRRDACFQLDCSLQL